MKTFMLSVLAVCILTGAGRCEQLAAQFHQVKPGETLDAISRRYGVPVARLREMNNLAGSRIFVGQRLVVERVIQTQTAKKSDPAFPKTSKAVATQARKAVSGKTVSVEGKHSYAHYTVRPGDSLSSVGRRFDISVQTLRAINGLRGTVIRPGQQLRVRRLPARPVALPPVEPTSIIRGQQKIYYRAQNGDSLQSIAEKFGVDRDVLKDANLLMEENVKPGQILVIPSTGVPVEEGGTPEAGSVRFGVLPDADASAPDA